MPDSQRPQFAGTMISKECLDRLRERVGRGSLPGKTIAFDEAGVVFHGNSYKRFQVGFDSELDTIRIVPKQGRVPADSQVIMPLFHGLGSQYSHAGAMVSTALGVFSNRGPRTGRGGGEKLRRFSLARELSKQKCYFRAATEAIDLPYHGAGPEGDRYCGVDGMLDWLSRAFRQLAGYRLPIVPVCRSASAAPVLEFAARHPGVIRGAILTGPLHPTAGYEECLRRDEQEIAEGLFVPNRAGREWYTSLYQKLPHQWCERRSPLGDVPVLILIGGQDTEVVPAAREAFRELISQSQSRGRHSRLVEVEGGGHDVLAPRPDDVALRVYTTIYEFVSRIVFPDRF